MKNVFGNSITVTLFGESHGEQIGAVLDGIAPGIEIDMDFMNLNQSAHGDREYGHIVTRMGIERKVIVGHWSDKNVQERIASWMRTAIGVIESSHIRVMRVADNMRNVAVTEGDKVEAQLKFGWEIDAYPVNEIAEAVEAISRLPRVSALVLAGSLMGGEITEAVKKVKSENNLIVISLNMPGSVTEYADLIITDPIQAGVLAVMSIADTAVFDINRLGDNIKF